MGINLAIEILEGKSSGGRHGGVEEAIDELTRESFWMTNEEIARVQILASRADSAQLKAAMAEELRIRRMGGPISNRVN